MLRRRNILCLIGLCALTRTAPAEFPSAPFYSIDLKGDFVVIQDSTRVFFGTQVDDFPVAVSWPGSLVKAFAHWSYLTNQPGAISEREITLNGMPIVGSLTGVTESDTNWNFSHVAAYTAEVTAIIQSYGAGTYVVGSVIDDPTTGAYGEGFTLLLVVDTGVPLRHVRVFTGAINSDGSFPDTGLVTVDMNPVYTGGPLHLFVNALDGQEDLLERFLVNGVDLSGPPMTAGTANNAFIGAEGPAHPFGWIGYDRAEGDVSAQVPLEAAWLGFETRGDFVNPDAIGHTLAAISYAAVISPGDLDSDGDVDLSDLSTLLAHFGVMNGAVREEGDTDADGDVDIQDLSSLVSDFGSVP